MARSKNTDHKNDLNESLIRAELTRILSSQIFLETPMLAEFFRFIVEETLAGRSKRIKQFTVATEVFGRGSSFDPQADPVVRLQAARLRRALDNYYANADAIEGVRIHLIPGSYVPRFETRESLRVKLINDGNDPEGLSRSGLPVIAVQPFTNLSGEKRLDHFAIGLSEEISMELTRFSMIRVVAFYSSFQETDQRQDPIEFGKKLNANFLLSGSLERKEDQLRIGIKLYHVSRREMIWSQRFDCDSSIEELSRFQEEVIQRVRHELGDDFGSLHQHGRQRVVKKRIKNLTAYEAILKEHYFQLVHDQDTFLITHEALENAAKLEPDFAPIWAYLGQSYIDAYVFAYADFENPLEQGIRCARKALTLDRNCQYAHHTNAFACLVRKDKKGIIQSAQEIIRINPNSAFMCGLAGFWLAIAGKYQKGVDILNASFRLNPHFPGWLLFAHYLKAIDEENYGESYQIAEDFGLPNFFWSPLLRAASLGLLNRKTEAQLAYQDLLSIKPDFPERACHYITFFVLSENIVNKIISGLRVAGHGD